MTRRPKLDLIVFPVNEVRAMGVHDAASVEALSKYGVPKEFFGGRFLAAQRLAIVGDADGHRLICFGTSGLSHVCVDSRSGEVVDFVDAQGASPKFVNSTLPLFTETVIAVLNLFPFYGRDASDEDVERSSREVKETIRRIDPPAVIPDRFWSTFVDDMLIGDFATESMTDD